MVELISIIVAVIGLYLAYYSYIRMKGYLDLDFHFEMQDVNLPSHLLKDMEQMILSGVSTPFKDNFNIYIDIKNTGYQNITIEKIFIERGAFLPNHEEFLLSNLDNKSKSKMQKEISIFLKGRTFKEVNKLISLNYKNSLDNENFFNEEIGVLYIQLNRNPITLKRQEKYKLSVTEILSDISYTFEGKNFTYFSGKIYCTDSLGRTWSINKKTKELFMMYSIGLEESYFTSLRNIN